MLNILSCLNKVIIHSLDNIAVDLKCQTLIPLSVEFRWINSAADIKSSPPGRNAMSCTWPKYAE